jgi:hypothetical protein
MPYDEFIDSLVEAADFIAHAADRDPRQRTDRL